MEYWIIAGVAIGLSATIVAFRLVRALLRRRVKLEVVDGELSLKKTGSIKGAFLFRCVVKRQILVHQAYPNPLLELGEPFQNLLCATIDMRRNY